MEKIKRVLQISIGLTVFGGVEQILYQIYKNIDKEKVQFDFLSPNLTTYDIHKQEIINSGGKIIELQANRERIKGKILYNYRLFKFLKKNQYEIVHINSGAFFFCLQVAIICKICGIKKVIIHSHNAVKMNGVKKIVKNILKPVLNLLADDKFACSKLAADAMFCKREIERGNIRIIKNGIDIDKFTFNEEIRNRYRKELDIQEKIVYGNVARFDKEKNHEFLIDVFFEIQKIQENAVLLLIGEGTLKNSIEEKTKKLNIDKKVFFLGVRKDVNKIMQAIDCIIMPSFYEGLPVVGVEAQTTGLTLICSDRITTELKLLDTTQFVSLDLKAEEWAKKICNEQFNNCEYRKRAYNLARENGYDIKMVAKEIENIYLN